MTCSGVVQGWVAVGYEAGYEEPSRVARHMRLIRSALHHCHPCGGVQTKKAVKIDRRGPDGRDHARKSINDELVAVISDGLYFYEQELRHHQHHRPHRDARHAPHPKVTVGEHPAPTAPHSTHESGLLDSGVLQSAMFLEAGSQFGVCSLPFRAGGGCRGNPLRGQVCRAASRAHVPF